MRSKSTNKDDASSSGKAHGKKSKSSQGTQPAKTEFANTLSALMHESWAQLSARPTQSHTSSYDTHDTPKDWTSAQKHDTSSEEEKDDDNASIISYEDELGRSRRGTRAQAARAAALKEDLNDEPQRPSWQPEQPKNLIHGVTVQTEAFNPDARLAAHMAHIAELRDRSSSPELVHYDADADPRKRGAGFYNFSKDEAERRRQMEELEKARAETEDMRQKHAREKRAKAEERAKFKKGRSERLLQQRTVAMMDILGQDLLARDLAPDEWTFLHRRYIDGDTLRCEKCSAREGEESAVQMSECTCTLPSAAET